MSASSRIKFSRLLNTKHHKGLSTPTYATRKLSVGLVSCMLGYIMAGCPTVALADTTSAANREATPSADTARHATEPADPSTPAAPTPAPAPTSNNSEDTYAADEAKIKDANDQERYRTTEMKRGAGVEKDLSANDQGNEVEGFSYSVRNPDSTDKDKKTFKVEVAIDKQKAQRTYTHVSITDSKNPKPANSKAYKVIKKDNKAVYGNATYESEAPLPKDAGNISISLTEKDLKHLNNSNSKVVLGWEGKYSTNQTNSKKQFFTGDNVRISFSVNPYPNENAALQTLRLTGNASKEKFPVQGQLVRTGTKIDNLLAEDYTRIAGEVSTITGKILHDASIVVVSPDKLEEYKKTLGVTDLKAGEVLIRLPKGALQDPNSIFNTPEAKGIQSLKASIFARPRTKAEFESALPKEETAIPSNHPTLHDEDDENAPIYNVNGTYVSTNAGSATIMHNGEKVVIDKQGIDRYDHYNKIGDLNINLDDTRYYDQTFDAKREGTDLVTKIKPGEAKKVELILPAKKSEFDKTPEEMNAHKKKGEVNAEINKDFIKPFTDAGWKIEMKDNDISTLTVTAPQNAKAGDFISVPLRYTYTNGSIDDYSFSFVVQQTTPKVTSTEVTHTFESEIPFASKEELDDTLPMGTINVVSEGKAGKKKVEFKQVVVDGKKGIINKDGKFEEGDDKFMLVETTLEDKVDRLVKVGVKPVELTVNTGYTTIIEEDTTLDAGKMVTDQDGVSGMSTVATTRDKATGAITLIATETTAPTPKKVRVGTKCPTCEVCPAPAPTPASAIAPTPTPAPQPQPEPVSNPSNVPNTSSESEGTPTTKPKASAPVASTTARAQVNIGVPTATTTAQNASSEAPYGTANAMPHHAADSLAFASARMSSPKHAKALPQTADLLAPQVLSVGALACGGAMLAKGMRKKKHGAR